MWFTQALEPKFTAAQLCSASGRIASGDVDAADPKQIMIRVPVLAPGSYTVVWKVLSVDTHRTEGSFGCEVKP